MTRLTHIFITALLLLAACSGEPTSHPGDTSPDGLPDLPEPEPDAPEPDLLPDLHDSDTEPDTEPDTNPDIEPDLAFDTFDAFDTHDTSPPPCPTWSEPAPVGALENPELVELSGLVASLTQDGVFWAHNDSGDGPWLFALDGTGADLGVVGVDGAGAEDWEDIGTGPCPGLDESCLYIGDIGDNGGSRSHIKVYVVPEPALNPGPNPGRERANVIITAHLTYPGGPRDAEALVVDPDTGDVYIISKIFWGGCDVFRATAPLQEGDPTEMELIATVSMNFITGADSAPDGTRLLSRNYVSADLFVRAPDAPFSALFSAPPCDAPLASESQGEAVAFTAEGDAYLTIGEGKGATVNHVGAE